MQRLDLKSLRYDRLGKAVLINGRKIVLEVTHEALEALSNKTLSEDEAVLKAADEQKRLTKLAEWVPADDGKIVITANLIMNDGRYEIGD